MSIFIKALFGFFEILTGILFLISGKKIIDNIIIFLAQQEILEDPNDLVANYFIRLSENFSSGTHFFASFYLLFHGVISIFLAIALLKDKLWAFPVAIALFGVFTAYQIYRYFHTYSWLLLFLIIFDLFVILIVFLEYRKETIKKLKII